MAQIMNADIIKPGSFACCVPCIEYRDEWLTRFRIREYKRTIRQAWHLFEKLHDAA